MDRDQRRRSRHTAHTLELTRAAAHGSNSLAALNDDGVSKHHATYYRLVGAIDLTPELQLPTPLTTYCPECPIRGVIYDRHLEKLGPLDLTCLVSRASD